MPADQNEVKRIADQAMRGRSKVRILVAVWSILLLVSFFSSISNSLPLGLLQSLVGTFILAAWYLGHNWARILFGCYSLLYTVPFLALAVWGLGYPSTYWLAAVGLPCAVLMGVSGVGIFRSKDMRAYLWYRREKRRREQVSAAEALETEIQE